MSFYENLVMRSQMNYSRNNGLMRGAAANLLRGQCLLQKAFRKVRAKIRLQWRVRRKDEQV